MIYEFIYDERRKCYYVPETFSVHETKVRNGQFQKYLGSAPYIVTREVWEYMKKTEHVMIVECDP